MISRYRPVVLLPYKTVKQFPVVRLCNLLLIVQFLLAASVVRHLRHLRHFRHNYCAHRHRSLRAVALLEHSPGTFAVLLRTHLKASGGWMPFPELSRLNPPQCYMIPVQISLELVQSHAPAEMLINPVKHHGTGSARDILRQQPVLQSRELVLMHSRDGAHLFMRNALKPPDAVIME